MRVSIRWTDAERQTVLAALDEGAVPQLDADVASKIRAATAGPASDDVGPGPAVDLEFHEAQRLKQWCDARREHATEDEPNALWTRIVARVNEVVQIAAPATDPGLSGGPARPPA